MTLVAARIVNDVSYVRLINDGIHFAWHAQYLVRLERDSGCYAQIDRSSALWYRVGVE